MTPKVGDLIWIPKGLWIIRYATGGALIMESPDRHAQNFTEIGLLVTEVWISKHASAHAYVYALLNGEIIAVHLPEIVNLVVQDCPIVG